MSGVGRLGRGMVVAALVVAAGCGALRGRFGGGGFDETRFERKPLAAHRVPLGPDGAPRDTVIGRSRTHRVREGETLLDVARYHDLGYNEIVEANPDVDPWLPPVGERVVLPTTWVLPCCTYRGMVLNIPEMRLYVYRRVSPERLLVHTYPVGIGRTDRRTPRGTYRVTGKTENPRWVIPESIRQEHLREHGDARRTIPGGHPDNPLGRHRIEISLPSYAIHGTNVPWGAGMPVSHGCARLYPEDIAHLFPVVEAGMRVEFTYQPVKVGQRQGARYLEAHPDLYGLVRSLDESALGALRRRGLARPPDAARVRAALARSRGVPVPLDSRGS